MWMHILLDDERIGGEGMRVFCLAAAALVFLTGAVSGSEARLSIPNDCIRYLYGTLRGYEVYDPDVLEGMILTVEWLDGMPDCVSRDYTDIAVRGPVAHGRVHDSESLPLIDRFRVYWYGGIMYSDPVMGFLIPFEDFLEGRTDI
jgi:hypothetical protein